MVRKFFLSTVLTSLLGFAWSKRHLVFGGSKSTENGNDSDNKSTKTISNSTNKEQS